MRQCHSLHLAGGLCALVAFLLYLNTLDCGIVYDDDPAILKNRDIRPVTPWRNILWHDFWGASLQSPTSHKSYRPLCVATFRLNYLVHELQPMGYHLVNVLLHSAVCWLYVQLCGSVFGEVWPAVIAGMLFAVHPIHTEAVAGVVGRAELLCAIFFLLALFAYRRASSWETGVSGCWWFAASYLLSVCSMLSKEQGITVMAVCVTNDFLRTHKLLSQRPETEAEKVPQTKFLRRFTVTCVFTICAVAGRVTLTHGGPSDKVFHKYINPALSLDAPYRQLTWLYLCFVNLWLMLSPSRLSVDWRFGAVPLITSLTDPHNLLTLLTFIAAAILAIHSIVRRDKVVIWGLSLLVLPYIPASNLFFPVGFVVAERVLYLPSMGFCLLVGFGIWKLLGRVNSGIPRLLAKMVIVYLLVVHSMKTLLRNRDWLSSMTIYASGVKFNPRSGLMLSNLGIEYAIAQNYTYAEELYRLSTDVSPHYSNGFFNLGKLLKTLRRYGEAEQFLQRAVELGFTDTTPSSVAQSYELLIDVISKNKDRMEEALELSEAVLCSYPTSPYLQVMKGRILLKLNRTQESIAALRKAIERDPSLPAAHYNLGLVYMKTGDMTAAEQAFRDLLSVEPNSTHGWLHLGFMLAGSGDEEKRLEAQMLLEQVLAAEPHNLDALLCLAQLHDDMNHTRMAIVTLRRLIYLVPTHTDALYRLANLLYRSENYSEALKVVRMLVDVEPGYRDSSLLLVAIQNEIRSTELTVQDQCTRNSL